MNNLAIKACIVQAQIASDIAKDCYNDAYNKKAWYRLKDKSIYKACHEISKSHGKSDIKFSVQNDKDNIANFIVYFNFKINNKKQQISFHTYNDKLERFVSPYNTRWDKKCSRDAALLLWSETKRYYNLDDNYIEGLEYHKAYIQE